MRPFPGRNNPAKQAAFENQSATVIKSPFGGSGDVDSNATFLDGNISLAGNSSMNLSNAATFDPSKATGSADTTNGEEDYLNEPPLLEDLGINISHISKKTFSVLFFKDCEKDIMDDSDMAGPLMFILLFGMFLLLSGKVHFSYIYGFSMIGCVGLYVLLNLMGQTKDIELYNTMSILGYSMLPIVFLAGVAVFITLQGLVGAILAPITILWATVTATRFFVTTLEMEDRRYLIAYPVGLFYACFMIITVF
eukprot:CAMPEP_0115041952 /NCGR_PEP_ID=MMETSP0216-20121206/45980_1 /TAXON_ID=223996 /ORGANISM="Protocruzia adherens, Strain Boccale" /LENGTH=250 /DNA_ID=CAMNT_0002423981 /DNA_START=39 /DNA_END=791 /DNA_ORIENTATION=+